MYIFLKMLSFFLRISPKFLNKFTYKCFYNLLFHSIKMRKKVVLDNLSRAFPDKSEEWYYNLAAHSYKFAVKDFLDFISFPRHFKEEEVHFNNIDILDNALKKKKGVIFVSGHFGNFEKMFYALGNKGYSICGVAKKQKRGDKFFKEIRENYMERQIYKGGEKSGLKNALNNNEILILLSDQDSRKKGRVVKFFGIPSSTPSGAAILNKRMGSPIIFFSIVKDVKRYNVNFKEINSNNSLSIDETVQAYTLEIEKTIQKNPEQYFWFHKRWKTSHS